MTRTTALLLKPILFREWTEQFYILTNITHFEHAKNNLIIRIKII